MTDANSFQSRNERLATDYREMLTIQDRPYLSWIAAKGEIPYVEEYLLTVRLRTYVLGTRDDRYVVGVTDRCTVRITLWDSYPYIAPGIRMLSIPPVFHPDWYSKGTYCSSVPWRPGTSLKDHVMRMLMTLKYEPSVMETKTPANYKALDWYEKNRDNSALFPSDPAVLTENSREETAAAQEAAIPFGEIVDSWQIR